MGDKQHMKEAHRMVEYQTRERTEEHQRIKMEDHHMDMKKYSYHHLGDEWHIKCHASYKC
jgi:hypothetical protein